MACYANAPGTQHANSSIRLPYQKERCIKKATAEARSSGVAAETRAWPSQHYASLRSTDFSPCKASLARSAAQKGPTVDSRKLRNQLSKTRTGVKHRFNVEACSKLDIEAQRHERLRDDSENRGKVSDGGQPRTKEGAAAWQAASSKARAEQAVVSSGIIACVKIENQTKALDAARAALDGGIQVLELTMSVPGALKGVNTLVREYPDAIIGVGTVFTREEAVAAADAGAHFVMSPVYDEEIVDLQLERDILYIPGAMTPTEIWTAYRKGCHVVKVFPVTEATLRALRRPLARLTAPRLSLVASHGIEEGDVSRYLGEHLAAAVVLSDAIFGHDRDAASVTEAAKRVVALAQSHRKP